mmetsp:Transcript_9848/g.21965  ORF Transcript_9848/g.21965 Transcript_9848/m.21965 type:complete len:299 (-) Transcript_9848:487-1383(-)
MSSYKKKVAMAAALNAAVCVGSSSAFVVSTRSRHSSSQLLPRISSSFPAPMTLRMSSDDVDVEALMAAAAKAREEARQLAAELGKDFDKDFGGSSKAPTEVLQQNLSPEEISTALSSVQFDDMSSVSSLDDLTSSGKILLWKAARGNRASPGMSGTEPYTVNLNTLESRTGGKLTPTSLGIGGEADVSLEDFQDATIAVVAGSTVSAVASLVFLPENVGATLCYFLALVPILWIGIGSSAPGILAGLIMSVRGGTDGGEDRLDRVCRHEAGHFLCGYLLGLPIRSYSIDDATGVPKVE